MKKPVDKKTHSLYAGTRKKKRTLDGEEPVEPIVMLKDGEKYCGQYVAMESFQKRDVITFGHEPKAVMESAKQKGFEHPVIFYVPDKGTVGIY
jgi:hypothetical protein